MRFRSDKNKVIAVLRVALAVTPAQHSRTEPPELPEIDHTIPPPPFFIGLALA